MPTAWTGGDLASICQSKAEQVSSKILVAPMVIGVSGWLPTFAVVSGNRLRTASEAASISSIPGVAEAPGVAVGAERGRHCRRGRPGVCENALYVHAGPEAGAHAATAAAAIPAAPMAEPRMKPLRDRADDKADDRPDGGAC